MTNKKDARLYNAAKKLADCWCANLGPAPKKAWYDGHQEMEQALVRFGRFVNDMEGGGKGQKYIELAKFLLDCRYNASRRKRSRATGIRPEPSAGDAAVRGRGTRGARHLHLLGHGGCGGGNARSRLSERGEVAVGQHRQQEVLRDRRSGQRRDVGRLRSELLAAQRAPIANRAPVAARSSSSGR